MPTMVIEADPLIDGIGAPPVADAILVLEDGRVRDVFEGAVPEGATPPDAVELRFTACTLLPGLSRHARPSQPARNGTTLETAML